MIDFKTGQWLELEDKWTLCIATAIVGSVAGGVATSAIGADASSSAADTQSQAQLQAAQLQANTAQGAQQNQMAMFQQIQQLLAPYSQGGVGALNQLNAMQPGIPNQDFYATTARGLGNTFGNAAQGIGQNAAGKLPNLSNLAPGQGQTMANLQAPFNPTQAQLASTPGYQFTLNQGLQATQNSYAAQGLGTSGAALKGAAQYATGLADSTYNQQLQNYLNQNQQRYNMLLSGQTQQMAGAQNQYNLLQGGNQTAYNLLQGGNTQGFNVEQANRASALQQLLGISSMGESAAAQTGNQGIASQTAANQLAVGGAQAQAAGITAAAQAQAAGTMGSANALSAGFGGIGATAGNLGMMNAMMQSQGGQGLFGSATPTAQPTQAFNDATQGTMFF